MEKARRLIDLAVDAKADAVKFQVFDIDCLISKEANDWKERLAGRTLSAEDFGELKVYCEKRGIIFLATAHDDFGLGVLESLKIDAYKIGSGERKNWEFIREVGKCGKPVILSTGMYEMEDVETAIKILRDSGNNDVAILHCTTVYPTSPSEVNLNTIRAFKDRFGGVVGYSDHSQGFHISLAAAALGADVIEKHISLDFNVPNAQDWKVSCGPETLPIFINQVREIEIALGTIGKPISESEKLGREWACKSLVFAHDHKVGDQISSTSLTTKRPGTGISPDRVAEIIGKTLKVNVTADSLLRWEQLR